MNIQKQHSRVYPETFFSKMFTKGKSKKSVQELLEFGIINIDKPSGPTSFDTSNFVKKKLKLRKTSHFGTLDPKVTGVLPVALNRACKLTGYFLGEDKEYIGIMRIHEEVSLEKIKKVIKEKFMGKIIQMPPVKSRVKRQFREREIKKFDILEEDGKNILFHTEVQGGTYIRKLCDDLGKELGIGAHMLELRRVRAGIFKEDSPQAYTQGGHENLSRGPDKSSKKISTEGTIVNLNDFEKAVDEYEKGNEKILREIIIPAEIVSEVYPVIEIEEESVDRILHGQPLYNKNLIKKYDVEKEQIVSVFCKDKFVGMFKIIKGKDIFAKSEFVMQPIKD